MLSLRLFGLFLLRYAARQLFWLLIQDPPRNTRKTSRVTPLAEASLCSMSFDVQRGKGAVSCVGLCCANPTYEASRRRWRADQYSEKQCFSAQ